LRSLSLRECPKLKRLPDLSATSLEDLSLEDCGISDLGVLPASLSGSLDLVSLKKLKSLAGLERCSGLRQISIGHAIEDASALAACNEIAITVDLRHANGNAIPEPLIETLAGLPQVRLRIEDSQYNYYSGLSLDNPQALARIPHLRTLDLSGCSLENLLFVVGLAELEELKIEPRSELSRKLGGCTFEGRGKVAKLQLQLLGMT
jgi:Leucine-rich repeat (LRR) protein